MRRILVFLIIGVFIFGAAELSKAVVIEDISFDGCTTEACTVPIGVTASDPLGGNLFYAWEVLNGDNMLITGAGANVIFDPPNTGPHPYTYKIKVTVTSDASVLSASQIISIFVKIAGDANGDGICNVIDKVQVRNCFGQPAIPDCEDEDVNCDGTCNVIDKVLVRNCFGQKEDLLDHYFYDNFECGPNKWVISGQDWGLIESAFQYGSYSFTDSPVGDYQNNADARATMKSSIDLSSATFPVLTFWHKYFMEYHDYISVEISTDGGFTWPDVIYTTGNRIYESTWNPVMVDLSNYKVPSVKIRFRLRETDSYVSDGWYIDNVAIREWNSLPQLPYPFFDSFENGLDNWAVSGLDWQLIESAVRGGLYSITDSPDGDYLNHANAVLMANGFFDLSAATSPVLTFWHKYFTEYHDYIYVEISSDGGFTWINELPITGNRMYQSTWNQVMVDLSDYKTSPVMIRFRLRETDSYVSDGWYIDNVAIREWNSLPQLPYPFFDSFENGLDNWAVSGLDWQLIESTVCGGDYSLTDSPDGDYLNHANAVLMANGFFDLSAATFPVLIFWHKYFMEYHDYIYVEISTDGGFTWINELPTTGNRMYQSTWTPVMVDLSDYKTSPVMIRFRLRETDSYVSDGWYIDNVEIREWDAVSALPYPFFDDFESGLNNWEVCASDGFLWGLTELEYRSLTHSVTDSPAGNYPNYANAILMTKGFLDLSSATLPALSFWHKYFLNQFDCINVEISTDGGLSWISIPHPDFPICGPASQSTWTEVLFNLSSYLSSSVKIRCRLVTDGSYVDDGWYVDDVEIKEFR